MRTDSNSQRYLEGKLRSLPKIEVPDGLKQKLFATIPAQRSCIKQRNRISSSIWPVLTAAALVLFATVVFVQNSGFSPRQRNMVIEVNEAVQGRVSTDQNAVGVTDINDGGELR